MEERGVGAIIVPNGQRTLLERQVLYFVQMKQRPARLRRVGQVNAKVKPSQSQTAAEQMYHAPFSERRRIVSIKHQQRRKPLSRFDGKIVSQIDCQRIRFVSVTL
jgi:hypothetical protein